jgi:hypothetical protein
LMSISLESSEKLSAMAELSIVAIYEFLEAKEIS